jgi:hypothetical protein
VADGAPLEQEKQAVAAVAQGIADPGGRSHDKLQYRQGGE